MKKKSINSAGVLDFIIVVIMTILGSTCVLPLLHIAAKSVSSDTAVLSGLVLFIPKGFNLAAYIRVFQSEVMVHSLTFTVFITILQTVISLFVTTLAAYPLSRKYLPGRYVISMFIMFTMYFSAGLIPNYLLMKDLHLLDTLWVLILPGSFSAYNMLLMRTYFSNSISDSLEESATIDGANQYQILFRIWLPLSKPIYATLALFIAVARWNGYGDAMYYTTSQKYQPIQLMLYNMILNSTSSETVLANEAQAGVQVTTTEVTHAAVIMFATLPILMVYPFVQKYFVKGVMLGAVKE